MGFKAILNDPEAMWFLNVWRVFLTGFPIDHETNITVAEVVAKDQSQAEKIALNTPWMGCSKTLKEMGVQVERSEIIDTLYNGKFLRWRGNTFGIKTS